MTSTRPEEHRGEVEEVESWVVLSSAVVLEVECRPN